VALCEILKRRNIDPTGGRRKRCEAGLWVDTEPMPNTATQRGRVPVKQRFQNRYYPILLLLTFRQSSRYHRSRNPALVYHRPDCPSSTATAPKNRKMFRSTEETEAEQYIVVKNLSNEEMSSRQPGKNPKGCVCTGYSSGSLRTRKR
jgi:hypothetical protein